MSKFDDPDEACQAVVKEAHNQWFKHETRTDDITIVLVQFVWPKDGQLDASQPTPVG